MIIDFISSIDNFLGQPNEILGIPEVLKWVGDRELGRWWDDFDVDDPE